MYPFITNPTAFPFGGFPFARRARVPKIDQTGIPKLITTGMTTRTVGAATIIEFGIDPRVWNSLPNEAVVLWEVKQPIPVDEEADVVTIAIPTTRYSTVLTNGTDLTVPTTDIPVLDCKNTQVIGSDVAIPLSATDATQNGYITEHLVYINKCSGVFRMFGVTAQTTPAAT